jgi:hypothetical protein
MKNIDKLTNTIINEIPVINARIIKSYKESLNISKDFSLKVLLGSDNIDKWENNQDIDEINLDEIHCIYFADESTKRQVIDLISNIDQSSYCILDNDEYELLKN